MLILKIAHTSLCSCLTLVFNAFNCCCKTDDSTLFACFFSSGQFNLFCSRNQNSLLDLIDSFCVHVAAAV